MIKIKITREHKVIVSKTYQFKQQTNRSLLNIRKSYPLNVCLFSLPGQLQLPLGGSVAEWLACWTALKGLGSNRSRNTVG